MDEEGGRKNEFETYEVFFFQTQGVDCTDTCLYLWQQGQYQQLILPCTALCSYVNMAHSTLGYGHRQWVDGL